MFAICRRRIGNSGSKSSLGMAMLDISTPSVTIKDAVLTNYLTDSMMLVNLFAIQHFYRCLSQ